MPPIFCLLDRAGLVQHFPHHLIWSQCQLCTAPTPDPKSRRAIEALQRKKQKSEGVRQSQAIMTHHDHMSKTTHDGGQKLDDQQPAHTVRYK